MLTLLFDGVAYGMLLFVLAVGLSITLGLMNFINLAHGAFAMLGGYVMVILCKRYELPFLLCLPCFCRGGFCWSAFRETSLSQALSKVTPGPSSFFHWFGLHVGRRC